ncbi:MAG: tRNA glutamyl-Q(34) synthetase GluQRS [Gammaproteobacteria bacterium]|nr:tRNA glutamyl-Q(34) synthetase GluQRS [Gammaproteobacteria bacterium]
MTGSQYIGRYAPSPTGALHLGNLRTALIAWLHARLRDGRFLIRMEDLDTPRVVAGSAESILRDLEWLGLDWDGPVLYQSDRRHHYVEALNELRQQGLVYPCYCSRKDIQMAASAPHARHNVYPGTCRELDRLTAKRKAQKKSPALRIRVADDQIDFHDAVLGGQHEQLSESCGDFVLQRADGIFAYQLVVVVDDLAQQVSHVVRGADLLSSTARQIFLARNLAADRAAIEYAHIPLLNDAKGQRMAKRDGSESGESWRVAGGTAESLVGQFSGQLGIQTSAELSAAELLEQLAAEQLDNALRDCVNG